MAGGKVYLVGAGPGDPGLITLKGIECLQKADLILYDGLVNPLILQHVSSEVERTCRVSEGCKNRRVLQQDEINQRLISAALEGKTVVRLKGGDPFIFGRGSEEAAALRNAGIEFEVVPGITAATAAAGYAGISVTHRAHASAVALITGHEDPTKPDSALDYDVLAKFPGTLVFYMGLHKLERIVESLMQAGKAEETPAAVISRGTTPFQKTVQSTLSQLPEQVRQAGLVAPSLIVIGDCVSLRDQIAWFEDKPLFGLRIGITRAEEQSEPEIKRALELGAQPVLLPTIEIGPPADWEPVDSAIARLDEYQWLVFTSANGVNYFLNRLWETGYDARKLARLKIATIGPSTAEALQQFHLRADLIPDQYRAEALAAALKPLVQGQKILWAGANRGREVLQTELAEVSATVDKIVVYENHDVATWGSESLEMLESGEIDWIGLSSPSIARNFSRLLTEDVRQHLGSRTRLVSISPVTTQAATDAGLQIDAEAEEYLWDGIFAAIQKHVSR
ncbi:Uroporphyrinogen-III C-methyltransferase [Gimesia chilikensis]|uniref:uroporphyrinogen-III C-methyltransferase n=1 Tax=Gimesia chilikensis TaxID=2605989 RepID=A0A517WLA5_9PLAN|nr:uroporphyrinogen-III C-methyltransferase [Gimesia chilikensis]QDU06034.1 Uroporphyrinogen-III C-methyltransferase [Gimesia chilikensis]